MHLSLSSQVRDLFHDVRAGLADVVFGYAAQGGLSANDVLRLLDFLSKVTENLIFCRLLISGGRSRIL